MRKSDFEKITDPISTELVLYRGLTTILLDGGKLTASELCSRCGISRAALYRYYPGIVAILNGLKSAAKIQASPERHGTVTLRAENDALVLQVAQIASLVDHYYCALQETTGLLRRRENDLANIRRSSIQNLAIVPK